MIGPYYPGTTAPSLLYCMIGDEPLMFQRLEELSPHQQAHHASMRFNILPFAMCFLAISRSEDELFLDKSFLEMEEFFDWHRGIYSRLNLETTSKLNFLEPDSIYPQALATCTENQKVASVCFSYEIDKFTSIEPLLAISKAVNSKIDLIERSIIADFKTPKSIILSREQLTESNIQKHFDFPNQGLLIKSDGLGGGFNVCRIETIDDCKEFIENYPPETPFVVQSEIDPCHHGEFIADYLVTSASVKLLNIRLKLTTGDKWFGNVYSPSFVSGDELTDLERCVEDVRARGYHSTEGYICGIDFFRPIDKSQTQLITDINARWTGGLPVAILIEKLGLQDRIVYSHLDEVFEDDLPSYRELVEK
ncbi:MAG: hypothetical protein K2Z81_12410, partial [Cyanobacteria bacterium]|nr:hypothetical protein [Cyanobacteriota bacterium]